MNSLVEADQELVRETNFSYGRYQQIEIDGSVADLMIDGLGRIIAPVSIAKDGKVQYVKLGVSREVREVLRMDPIYRGDTIVAWALYLAEKGATQ